MMYQLRISGLFHVMEVIRIYYASTVAEVLLGQ